MSTHTNIQIINDPDGKPAYVVIPYQDYIKAYKKPDNLIPHDVVGRTIKGASPIRAWREYLGITQTEIAIKLNMSQSAYAQQENSPRIRKSSRQKIADALGINESQLDF